MATGSEEPNRHWWALLFGVLGALAAAVLNAVVAYFAVTGFRIDWMTWDKRPVVETDVASLGLGLAVFLSTFLVAGIAGAAAWFLARRGRVRGKDEGPTASVTSWSEFSFAQSVGVASVVALFAGLAGFLVAQLGATEGVDGPVYFLLGVGFGAIGGLVGAFLVARAVADAYASGRVQADNPSGNVVSRIQLWSAENAVAVVAVTTLLVFAAGFGITKVDTDADVTNLLPRGNGNTTAAKAVESEFKSTFTQQVTFQLHKNPEACRQDAVRELGPQRADQIDCQNITAEPYVRAMEEMYERVLEDEGNPVEHTLAVNTYYKTINWTLAGGQDAPPGAFSLPPPNMETCGHEAATSMPSTGSSMSGCFEQVNQTVWRAIPDTITPIIDTPNYDDAASLFLVPSTYEGTAKNIGDEMIEFRDDYVQDVEDGETTWTIWGEDNPPLFTVDIPLANAHQSTLAEEDFETLFPLIFGFIVVALYFSFRNFTAIGMAGATLLNAAVITYGLMGWMDIPLNSLNLVVLPLILGNGIDYAIHQVTEFAHHKREGYTDAEALRASGGLAGFAMFIATATSVSGLLVMTISPSLLMAQVGLLAVIAMVSVYLLTITFMPALLALAPTSEDMGQNFEVSGLVTALARTVSRRRVVVGVLVVAVTAAAFVGMQHLTVEEFGEPAQNFPEDDWLREEHEEGLTRFYNLDEQGATRKKANIIAFLGDNTDLQSHRYMDTLQGEMKTKDNLDMSTSRTLPFLLRTWLTVRDGPAGAGEQVARDYVSQCNPPDPRVPTTGCPRAETADNYPQTREEIQETMDEAFQSPLSVFSSLFTDHPSYNISIMTFSTTTGDFQDARAAWTDFWEAEEQAREDKPEDVQVAFVGNTALNYLFITEELPWLSYLGYVAFAVLLGLIAMFTKRFRAVFAVGTVTALTTIWWLGVLPAFDIGLAITLMLPAVFITSIGSDYAAHMTWNLLQNPDRQEVYGVVGKAILFSAITDIGAFAIFTQTQNVAASEAMVATVIAIATMFAVTILTMPMYYPLSDEDEDDEAEARTARGEKPPVPA